MSVGRWLIGTVLATAIPLQAASAGRGSSADGAVWREKPASEKAAGPVPLQSDTYSRLAHRLTPTTVNIQTEARPKRPNQPPQDPNPDYQEFFEFFRRFIPPDLRPRRGAGSGFLISPDGYILTNNHVVEGADKVTVVHSENRQHEARVIGRDAKTDLALLKIDTSEELPFSYLGDSDAVEIGEPVLAIGNPFGVGTTLTAGIVSATGRRIGAGPYEDFIQTDAPINPGNSGGPLFNIRGEVIGINTMIFSRSGGSEGIGFAIPINMAKSIIMQLKNTGRVARGYLGVNIQKVDEALADQFGLGNPRGALVTDLREDGPAKDSDLRRGDIILEFDGKPIEAMQDLPWLVAQTPVGKSVTLRIWRGGDEKTVTLAIGRMPEEREAVADSGEPSLSDPSEKRYGLRVQDLDAEAKAQWAIEADHGALVSAVSAGSAAEEAGLRPGDLIVEADHQKVERARDFGKILEKKTEGALLLLIQNGEGTRFAVLKAPPTD